jgi:hypothetical protein
MNKQVVGGGPIIAEPSKTTRQELQIGYGEIKQGLGRIYDRLIKKPVKKCLANIPEIFMFIGAAGDMMGSLFKMPTTPNTINEMYERRRNLRLEEITIGENANIEGLTVGEDDSFKSHEDSSREERIARYRERVEHMSRNRVTDLRVKLEKELPYFDKYMSVSDYVALITARSKSVDEYFGISGIPVKTHSDAELLYQLLFERDIRPEPQSKKRTNLLRRKRSISS